KSLQWIEQQDWRYRRTFIIDHELLSHGEVELVAEGLDTFCDVFINDKKVGDAKNMFVGHRFAIKGFLRLGENSIEIRFRSPIKETMPQYLDAGYAYPAENDKSTEKLSVYCRKAPCHFGWDWGPRFVTSGIWRDIYLQAVEPVKIDNLYFCLSQLSDDNAHFSFHMQMFAQQDFTGQLNIRCEQAPELNRVEKLTVSANSQADKNLSLNFSLSHPKKWWPNGLGEAFLYDFVFELIENGKILSVVTQKVGLRTLEVVNVKDNEGECFYLQVNGQKVFMKGANYIPDDSFLNRVTAEKHRSLFTATQQANMNMLRVWGGGIYQDDYFYELADEHGILIWQDFYVCLHLVSRRRRVFR
ncbi:MAG: glycoside hydrolase family 2 protein, partial [Paraglaciecola sp.]|nr:glycoside hydrolase family 2 protein [Paraglaciecola sp.]